MVRSRKSSDCEKVSYRPTTSCSGVYQVLPVYGTQQSRRVKWFLISVVLYLCEVHLYISVSAVRTYTSSLPVASFIAEEALN